jgi:hypothetical protein
MVTSVENETTLRLRALSAVVEPVVGSVYFSPEAHNAYHQLGFEPSPGPATDEWGARHWGEVMMTDYVTYFYSRGAMLGEVSGELVAAAFGVFKPSIVVDAINLGREITDQATIWKARDRGGVAQLERILGERPEGIDRVSELLAQAGADLQMFARPMYAGLLGRGMLESPVGRMWRLAERLREFRGDAHVAAFTTAGFDGCEIQLLTERVAGMPPRTYTVTRGWDDADQDAAEARLGARGLLADGVPTDAGRAAREEIEQTTDRLCMAMHDSLGDDLPELVGLLAGWVGQLREGNGYYPSSPQEAIMSEDVQSWMEAHDLPRFSGAGHTGAATEGS